MRQQVHYDEIKIGLKISQYSNAFNTKEKVDEQVCSMIGSYIDNLRIKHSKLTKRKKNSLNKQHFQIKSQSTIMRKEFDV